MDILFRKVMNNIVIRKRIKFYLNLFNIYYHTRTFTLKEYSSFQFKSYLKSVAIEFNKSDKSKLLEWMNELPPNVDEIIFKNMDYFNNPTFTSFCGDDFDTFGRPLLTIDIPSHITSITFDPLFDQPFIEPLPNTLKHVEFGKFFRQPLHCINNPSIPILSDGLLSLQFFFKGLYNLKFESHHLPKTLIKLILGLGYNQPIGINILPEELESITFTYHFNQYLPPGVLPSKKLKYLRFGNSYNKPFEIGSLPSTIKTLILGTDFNQPILKDQLPNQLEELIFANTSQFNQYIDDQILPSTITRLHLGSGYYQPLTSHTIPPSITELSLGGTPNTKFGDYWSINANTPTLLGSSMISTKYIVTPNCLPRSISSLQLNPMFFIKKGSIPNSVYELQGSNFKFASFFPSSIKKYKINCDFNRPLKVAELPPQLLTLDLGNDYDQPITNNTFSNNQSLTKLKLSTHFNSTIQPFSLPPLKKLYLGFSYNNPQPFNLPISLTYLDLGNEFNQPLENYHLDRSVNLKYLKLGSKFQQPIQTCNSLPPNLILLELGLNFIHPVHTNWLPPNLKALIIQGATTIDEFPLSPLLEFIIVPSNNNKFLNSLYHLNIILNQKRKIKQDKEYINNVNNNNNTVEYDLFNYIKVTNYNSTKIFSKYYKLYKE